MARTGRKPRMREVPLSEVKDDLSRYLREAETQEIVAGAVGILHEGVRKPQRLQRNSGR